MSEKPFWEGKTLMEIQNLDKRVKVTMENGDVFIGKLVRRSRDTDGICSLSMQLDAHRTYLHVFSAESSDTQPIIPSYVDTVELLDDPNYERGAERQPTDEEIEAGAKAFYEALKPDYYPQWDSDCALRAEYYDAMRLAVKAMQGKATEE